MPVTFSSRPPRPSSSPLEPVITDADDTIVLSDLVRSGEASRLRRRGAIRDGTLSSHRQSSSMPSTTVFSPPAPAYTAPPSQTLFRPLSPVWRNEFQDSREPDLQGADDDAYQYDDDDENGEWQWGRMQGAVDSAANVERDVRRQALEADIRIEDSDQSSGSFILLCGGELPPDSQDLASHHTSSNNNKPRRRPSAFCPSSPPQRPPRPRATNGCGTIIHISGIPRRRHGVWIARGAATSDVVPMPTAYFDCTAVAKMMKSACGCVREGVGCSVCGNILGTIYTPCQAAADGLFTPPTPTTSQLNTSSTNAATSSHTNPSPSSTATPQPSLYPSGPSYWLPTSESSQMHHSPTPTTATSSSSKTPASPPRLAIYTFFSAHVRSSVPYTFPVISVPPPPTPAAAPDRAPAPQYDTTQQAASSSSSMLPPGYGYGSGRGNASVYQYPYAGQRSSSSNVFGRSNELQPQPPSRPVSLSQSQSLSRSANSYPSIYPSPYTSSSQAQSRTTLASSTSLEARSAATLSDTALPTPLQRQPTVTSGIARTTSPEPLPVLSSSFDPSRFSGSSTPPPPPPPPTSAPVTRPPARRWTSYTMEDVMISWDEFVSTNSNNPSMPRNPVGWSQDRDREADRERVRMSRRGRSRMTTYQPPGPPAPSQASTTYPQPTFDVFLEVAARRRERQRQRQEREDAREHERDARSVASQSIASDEAVVSGGLNNATTRVPQGTRMAAFEGGGQVEEREYSYEELRLLDEARTGALDPPSTDEIEGLIPAAARPEGEDFEMGLPIGAQDGDAGEKPEGALSTGHGGTMWAER